MNEDLRIAWRQHLLRDGRREPGVVQQKLAGVDALLSFVGTPISEITPEDVAAFKAHLLARVGRGRGQIAWSRAVSHIQHCGQFLRWLKSDHALPIRADTIHAMKAGRTMKSNPA